MADTWIVKMSHFNYKDNEIENIPKTTIKLWQYFGDIIFTTFNRPSFNNNLTGIQCRKRPNRKCCEGIIHSKLNPEGTEIEWWCPVCMDKGRISDWRGTRWDLSNKKSNMIDFTKLKDIHKQEFKKKDEGKTQLYKCIQGEINIGETIPIKDEKEGCIDYINFPKIITFDNKEYNWIELGKEIMTYEGFKITIKIED
ncbi:MAG: hypothetical protein KAT05_05225 [Spirochaetes bacterium]|nr:hypothetical protein [Spirochaetota bacterium]